MQFLKTNSGILTCALLSGFLLSAAWPANGFAPLLFVAFIPLLFAQDALLRHQGNYNKWIPFVSWYLAFFTFNLLTTWWVKYASLFGAIAAIVCNALFMALIFAAFHKCRKKTGDVTGYVALVLFWISFEHIHMDWDLSWPWLTLGNGFAGWVKMVQWYEFTGVLGGSVWVLVANILIYRMLAGLIFKFPEYQVRKNLVMVILLLAIPLSYSFIRYFTYTETVKPVQVAVVQPNIDPYNEKFSGMSSAEQLQRILKLAKSVSDDKTDFVVAPETALPDGMWEEELPGHPQIQELRNFLQGYPDLKWVIGLASNRFYPDSNQRSATARKFTDAAGYYDSYNTALFLDKNGSTQIHHKSKLVPGVEKMPFPQVFKHLESFAIDLGGMSGSLGVQEIPSVFKSTDRPAVAPVVCYESIYGDYLTQYVAGGAELIFIITNDGWWSDTPGYRQHLKYATLRAIETRRSIARSANTGISCFINQRGDILQATSWWQQDAIKATLNANDFRTFYSKIGDIAGTIALGGSLFLLAAMLFRRKMK